MWPRKIVNLSVFRRTTVRIFPKLSSRIPIETEVGSKLSMSVSVSVCLSPLKNRSFCWILALAEITLRRSLMTTLRYFKCFIAAPSITLHDAGLMYHIWQILQHSCSALHEYEYKAEDKRRCSQSSHRGFCVQVDTDCYKLSRILRSDFM